MNLKRLIISAAAVFIAVFVYDFVVHGKLFVGMYEETKHLWRPEGEHKMRFILMSQLGFALVASFIFTFNYEKKGIGEGARYGFLIGLLMGSMQLGTYCYMPIPLELTLSWATAEVARGVLAGIVLSLTYRQ